MCPDANALHTFHSCTCTRVCMYIHTCFIQVAVAHVYNCMYGASRSWVKVGARLGAKGWEGKRFGLGILPNIGLFFLIHRFAVHSEAAGGCGSKSARTHVIRT